MKSKTYESAMARLSEIVSAMENGGLPLDESLKLFEEGAELAAYCNKCLDEAEQKVVTLTEAEQNNGQLTVDNEDYLPTV